VGEILEGIRVLDLTHFMAGPFCTILLADMGAEVIKIEPLWGEALRMSPPAYRGLATNFAFLNRNKRGMTLNLKSKRGIEIFEALTKKSDVVIENFTPGTMDRLGLGYDRLKEINPRVVYVSVSGFGQSGPYTNRPSFDIIAQAMSGIASLTGAQVGRPVYTSDYLGDSVPALYATISVLAALYYRSVSGRGQKVDVAQLDCMVSILPSVVCYLLAGETVPQSRRKYPMGVYGMFKAADGYLAVAAPPGAISDRLARIVDAQEVDGAVFEKWVGDKPVAEVVEKLKGAEVPVGPAMSIDQVVSDPHVLSREMIVEVDHPQAGRIKVNGFPIKFSETPGRVELAPPLLGQHNEQILREILGLSVEEVVKLREEKVI